MENLLRFGFTPKEIAKNMYLHDCYKAVLAASKASMPIKDIQYINPDLQAQFARADKDDIKEFHQEVLKHKEIIERQVEIKRLRNQISNKQIRLEQLLNNQ